MKKSRVLWSVLAIALSMFGCAKEGVRPGDEDGTFQYDPPSGFQAKSDVAGSVTLSWDRVEDAGVYIVSYGESEDMEEQLPNAETSVTIKNLKANKLYYFAVATAGDLGTTSDRSDLLSLVPNGSGTPVTPSPTPDPSPSVTPPTPGAPAKPTMTVSSEVKKLNFSWAAASGATYYQLFHRSNAASAFTVLESNLTGLSHSISPLAVHRTNWAEKQYQLKACNALGCTASDAVSILPAMLGAIGMQTAGSAVDLYGLSVAISGDGMTMAVGAPKATIEAGKVYTYVRSAAGDWSLLGEVKASAPASYDNFGTSVSLSNDGKRLVVGAPGRSNGKGAAYVFARATSVFAQAKSFQPSSLVAGDHFGTSVAMSGGGGSLAVGCPYRDFTQQTDAGEVYVYTTTYPIGWEWDLFKNFTGINSEAGSLFGFSLSFDSGGSRLAVGSLYEAGTVSNQSLKQGVAYVYLRTGTGFTQEARLVGLFHLDEFGRSVSISGDGKTLAVGSPFTGFSVSDSGMVKVFAWNGTAWSEKKMLQPFNAMVNMHFGTAVALNGDGTFLAVGARDEAGTASGVNPATGTTTNTLARSGAVYTFVYPSMGIIDWKPEAYVKSKTPAADKQFGYAVGVSADGGTLVGSQLGSVFTY